MRKIVFCCLPLPQNASTCNCQRILRFLIILDQPVSGPWIHKIWRCKLICTFIWGVFQQASWLCFMRGFAVDFWVKWLSTAKRSLSICLTVDSKKVSTPLLLSECTLPIVQSAAHHNGAGQPNTNAPLYISTFYLHFNLTWSQQKASLIKFLIKNTKQHRKFNKMSPLTLLGWYTLVWQSLNPPEISIPAIQPDSRIFCFHCRRAMPQSILCVSSRHIQGGCIFNQLSQSHWLNMGVNGHCLHSLFPTTISFVAFLHIVMLNI